MHYTHIKSMSQNPLLSQARALRERLSNLSPSEQEEQEYLSELIEIERDPEDRRPSKSRCS